MKTAYTVFLAVVVIGCLCGGAFAAEYFVANNGDDLNPGTIEQPWETITHAWRQVSAGDTINVRAGVYPEGRIWVEFLDGAPGAYITF